MLYFQNDCLSRHLVQIELEYIKKRSAMQQQILKSSVYDKFWYCWSGCKFDDSYHHLAEYQLCNQFVEFAKGTNNKIRQKKESHYEMVV